MISPVEFTHDTIVSISFQLAQLPPRRNPLIMISQAPLQTSIGYLSQSSPSLVLAKDSTDEDLKIRFVLFA